MSNVDKYGYFNKHASDKPTVQFDFNRDYDHFATLKP